MPIPQMTKSPRDWEKYKKVRRRRAHANDGQRKKNFSFLRIGRLNGSQVIRTLLLTGVAGFLIGAIVLVGVVAYYSKSLPDPNKVIDRVIAQSTKIYDRSGEVLLWEIHGDEKRTVVELDQISDYVIWGTIAAEDKDFYNHKGFKITSIMRAIIIDILTGKRAQGGSTITQQFVKNAILTNEKSFSRKFKELILAYQIEKKFTKDQILKLYFNEIPFGSVNYGVESAANYYFGKKAADLDIAESAIIAALPQAPSFLSPYGSHTEELFARQRWIIDRMIEDGYITKEEGDAAKTKELTFKKLSATGINAPHFVFYVQEQLAKLIGDKALSEGGLTVITTLDWEKQQAAEEAIAENRERIETYGASNAALVSVDAKTGEILAMVGSVDFTNEDIDGQVNVAVRPRQPGSSIKPVVYAAAFERGYYPETILYDVNTRFPGGADGPYEPKNFDLKERGAVSMRSALAGSLNIPAVKTLYLAGVDTVQKFMVDLGYSTITPDTPCGLSLVLGGCEITLLDHVGAYTAFARDGERAETASILEVKNKDGKIVHEFKENKRTVVDKETARRLNDVMSDDAARAYVFGSGSNLTLPGRPVAAKTGTTQKNKDNWTIGFTPSYVTGVWVGNNDSTSMHANATGAGTAAPIWNVYMRKTLDGTPVEQFKKPKETPSDAKPRLRGEINSLAYEIDRASGKLATDLTPTTFREKKTFTDTHSILHYVKKDDPNGPAPENPANDAQYQAWETAIQDWLHREAEKKAAEEGVPVEDVLNISNEAPPTEYDDLHTESNKPSITILSPQAAQQITSPSVTVSVSASAPRGVSRVEYYIGDTLVKISASSPFSATLDLTRFENGFQKLRAIAYDDIDNSRSAEVELNLQLPYQQTQLTWISPRNNGIAFRSSFPLNVSFSLNKTKDTNKVRVYYRAQGSSERTFIGEVTDLPPDGNIVAWNTPPDTGVYELIAELEEKTGERFDSEPTTLNVQ